MYLFEVSVCIFVFYLAYIMLFRGETFYQRNRFYLLFGAILSLFLPLLEFQIFTNSNNTLSQTLQTVTIGTNQLNYQIEQGISAYQILVWVYLIGFVFALGRFAWQMTHILKFILKSDIKVCRGYKMIETGGKLPTFSFFNYLFWDNTKELSEEEADKILHHELKHIWDKHTFDVIFMEMLKVVLWFNPIVYIYANTLRFHHEYIADNAVLKESDKASYRALMVRSLFQKLNIQLAHSFNQAEIKKRIDMMQKKPSEKLANYKLLLILPLLSFLILAFSIKDNLVEKKENIGKSKKESLNRFANAESNLDDFYQDLITHLKYPKSAEQKGLEGKVYIQFTVEKDGTLSNYKVLETFDDECAEAAIEAIKKTKTRWLSGKVNGKPVRQNVTVPINFSLRKKK